jgi:UDP-N-acetylmuramoyl-L-alanyl-D-glutamate--2,6-diaminopimelate ligase
MKELKDILYGVHLKEVKGTTAIQIDHLTFDSREVTPSSVFFAIRGSVRDGHDFIPQVLEQGCAAVVADHRVDVPNDVQLIVVEDTSEALPVVAKNFYDDPSSKLKLVGVTGTNGKTTTTTLLFRLYRKLGYEVGLISTVSNRIGDLEIPTSHTTPDPISLNQLLAQMVDSGVTHCFMEVSSHAIHQNRILGLQFTGAAFTNITHEHLDYHKTFKEYIHVKKAFFDGLSKSAFALTNLDDKNGTVMLQNTAAKKRSYALKTIADYHGKVLENQFSGLVLNINGKELWTRLIGDFNAYNLLAVFGISQELGEDETEVLTVLSELHSVDGRFEYVRSTNGVIAIVDYAHTPDALENVLKTIENIRTKNEQVITVVGCGGDRDATKRPVMAEIACKYSDKVILTSDNPRSEDPQKIIDDMMEGVDAASFRKTLSIVSRGQAIKTAVSLSESEDIILIAGKGHEKYQLINGERHDFDDLAIVKELLTKLEK